MYLLHSLVVNSHWLFGERIRRNAHIGDGVEVPQRDRIRGWFPRRCVVEVYDENDDDDVQHHEADSSGDVGGHLRTGEQQRTKQD